MRVVELRDSFSLNNLIYTVRPDRHPGSGQVLVHIQATSLNYRDYLLVTGAYDSRQRLPLVPLSDGAGEVVEVGPGVTRVAVGDRICPTFRQTWFYGPYRSEVRASSLGGPLDGTMQEYMLLDEQAIVKVPDFLTPIEAATLPCAAVTAWNALRVEADIGPEQRVLVQGTGGVSLFALQFAKMSGAEVILISSSDEKLERGRKLGADHLINYKATPDWDRRVRELTDGIGVDHVIEIGGAGTLEKSVRCCRLEGQISLIGNVAGTRVEVSLPLIFMRHLRLQGITTGNRASFEDLLRALALHKTRPVVDRVFAFEEVRQALEYLASGQHFGKVCIGF